MKIKKLSLLRYGGLVAFGVFLGRGAQADTTLDFNTQPPDQLQNAALNQTFGDYAAVSSNGVTVSGFGTPNIGLTWSAFGGDALTEWEYYLGGPWASAQLNNSYIGATFRLTFVPNNPSAAAVIKSFNFFPYYVSNETYAYNVRVLAGSTVVSGPTHISFKSDAAADHKVSFNYTGAAGQTLKLEITRVACTPGELGGSGVEGSEGDIAVDDIIFAQTPTTAFPAGPQVVSVSPGDGQSGVPAPLVPAVLHPYMASITNGALTLVAGSIQLKLDGSLVSPSPTISSSGGMTNVSQSGLNMLTSGPHTYTLTYDDNLGGHYTNESAFSSIYATLPASYALLRGSGLTNGFTYRTVSASLQATNLDGTIARAIAQLNGTLTNQATGQPFTNEATLGPNPDGSFDVDTVLNFTDNGSFVDSFPNDTTFPGLDLTPNHWFSTEGVLFLDLPAGYYRFGVNSDDGFEVNATPPAGIAGSPIVLGVTDFNHGVVDTLFDVLVPTSGIYPFQIIYFQSSGYGSCEFFSVTNFVTGGKVLVNDPDDPNAIPSYRVLKPRITSINRNGSNAAVGWAYGTPPFQVQFKTNVTDAVWNNIGSPTANRTANVPIQSSTGFIRVFAQ